VAAAVPPDTSRQPKATTPDAAAATPAAPSTHAAPLAPDAGIAAPVPNAALEASLLAQQQTNEALQDKLAKAEEELAQERAAREQDAERDRAQVHGDAERRGHADGLALGEAEGREQFRLQCERVRTIATTLAHAKQTVLEEAEDLVVEIAFAALCRILGDKLVSRATVASLVEQLVKQEREPHLLTVRLCADDIGLLQDDGEGARLDPRIRLVADATITLGGCAVDSQRGTLDARLDLQLDRLRSALLLARSVRRGAEEPT
jgi:flagellar assembly protein FliH